MRFLDTNVVLRYLMRNNPKKAQACYELFQRLQRGDAEVVTAEANATGVSYDTDLDGNPGIAREEPSIFP